MDIPFRKCLCDSSEPSGFLNHSATSRYRFEAFRSIKSRRTRSLLHKVLTPGECERIWSNLAYRRDCEVNLIVNRIDPDPMQWRATYLVTAYTSCFAVHYFQRDVMF